ncbi:MAG: mechanosensitive ion channel family protein [Phycisphaeraceae bacterium]
MDRRVVAILSPLLLVLLAAAVMVGVDRYLVSREAPLEAQFQAILRGATETLVWLAAAFLISRGVDVFLWRRFETRQERPAPKLLISVVRLLLVILTIGIIITLVLHQPLTGLVVSSGVVGVVLGFALQRMISDFFSGIALSMESPFRAGDWIEVDGQAGRVAETNWRATRLVTLELTTVILPNSYIAERKLKNFGQHPDVFRTEVGVTLEFSVAPPDAKRVLLAAVRAVDGILTEPPPDVMLASFGDTGANYRVRFHLTNFRNVDLTKDKVNISISRQLWQAGYNVPYPKRDVYHAEMPHRQISRRDERDALLARVEVFEPLEALELGELARAVVEHHCKTGDEVVAQGQAGESLFVVVDGLLEARVFSDGEMKPVGRIGAGEFFGEMSLLTGSPRGATVVAVTDATLYELSREVIQPIILRRPAVAEAISHVVALRRVRNDKALHGSDVATRAHQQRTFASELLFRIRGFFGMK